MCKAEDGWNATLTALRAVTPAEAVADIRDILFSVASSDCTEGISVAAFCALQTMIAAHLEDNSLQSPDLGPFLDKLSKVLVAKAEDASPGVRTAAMRCLGALAHTPLRAEQLAAVALAAQRRLTDVDAKAADAAAELLSVLGVPVALLAAAGVNVGGIQDEPVWRTQVRSQCPSTRCCNVASAARALA